MQLQTNLKKEFALINFHGQENDYMTEALINDFGQQASKDNLELGCKMIKKAVIDKALTKVREDLAIMRAVDQRRAARSPQEFKATIILDKAMSDQIAQLPQQLKPSPDGLTD